MDKRDVVEYVSRLGKLHDDTAAVVNRAGTLPFPGSQADLELSKSDRPESLQSAFAQGSLLIESTADHLMAFINTVTEPVQSVAPWTCTRAAIESSSMALWILDPHVGAVMRIGRSLAFRYEGQSQKKKILVSRLDQLERRKSKVPQGVEEKLKAEIEKIIKRMDEISEIATALGYRPVLDKKDRRVGAGDRIPNFVELVRDGLDEEPLYRMLSAAVHGHTFALAELSFRHVPDLNSSTGPQLEKSMSGQGVLSLSRINAKALLAPFEAKLDLFGWRDEFADEIIRDAKERFEL